MQKDTEAELREQIKELTSHDYYFESYAHFGIHEEMLKDEVRTKTYKQAIVNNPELFRGKTVLDVGCGTGILSMFAAQAGAAHVYALDCSSIIDHAITIIEENGFSDRVTFIKGRVEDVDLPVQYVDIIVSEWMGYCLFYENMLETVIIARDKWLKKETGWMLPDRARLYVVGIEDTQYRKEKIDFWDNVYGFKMSCLKEEALTEPIVDICDNEQVITNACTVIGIDLMTVTIPELSFSMPFEIKVTASDILHALVAYFDVAFTRSRLPGGGFPQSSHSQQSGPQDLVDEWDDTKGWVSVSAQRSPSSSIVRTREQKAQQFLSINTGPHQRNTHWKQTVFYLPQPWRVRNKDVIEGQFTLSPNKKNKREMDITILYRHIDREQVPGLPAPDGGVVKAEQQKEYKLR
ncbi:MAG: putative Protein arginine N-methyltransferase [Streblomastix strix]|uniref:type I protein arginine methyltransferase n=1 Tax=Streblomastix strix TaxID=222440 RepID=A0A5J4V8C9_9EUKA|nr:MAG: putative Protein arginine N-methyltransferase [Streblomastix strix]